LLQRVISILPMSAQGHFRQIDTRDQRPRHVRFAPIACEFQRFAVAPGVMVTRSTSATLG
jgi:hypothetical protein